MTAAIEGKGYRVGKPPQCRGRGGAAWKGRKTNGDGWRRTLFGVAVPLLLAFMPQPTTETPHEQAAGSATTVACHTPLPMGRRVCLGRCRRIRATRPCHDNQEELAMRLRVHQRHVAGARENVSGGGIAGGPGRLKRTQRNQRVAASSTVKASARGSTGFSSGAERVRDRALWDSRRSRSRYPSIRRALACGPLATRSRRPVDRTRA